MEYRQLQRIISIYFRKTRILSHSGKFPHIYSYILTITSYTIDTFLTSYKNLTPNNDEQLN